MKIYYNGKRIRDNVGRFSSFKKNVRSFFRKLLKVTLFAGLIYLVFITGRYSKLEYVAPKVEAEVKDTLSDKVKQLKGEVLDTLKSCESGGYSENDGIIIFDSNNQASIGSFQFQKKTVIHYYKTLYGKEITPKEAVLIALDDEKARELAEMVIFEDSKGAGNWHNCSKKHGLYEKVKIIKELEQ
jgi:hypothetical protein